MEKLIVLLCILHGCYGVIYRLNESDYKRMPSKYVMDPFEECHKDPDGIYCFGEYALVSDTPSPLLDMIREYSDHNTTHFNHTKIFRGICVTQSCTKYNLTDANISMVLEACVNETIYDKYQLKTRITHRHFCNQPPKDMQPETLEKVVAAVIGLILLVNLIGSLYEPFNGERKDAVTKFLRCFFIRKNWRKLTAPVAETSDPRLKRLKSLHGIRLISIWFVIMAHSIIACVVLIANPEYVEQMYHFESLKIIFSGMIIMQTFLMMSGFLLTYNALLQAEKHSITWSMFPKLIILRWLRLTPSYAVVLALHITWFKFLTDGPMWWELVGNEAEDCKQNWLGNILYINNYNDESQCMQHTWYLAADTQLYYYGVFLFLLLKTPRSRKIVLPIMIAVGAIIPGIVTYYHDLDGSLIASPEAIHGIFMNEPTFHYAYRRGHTNLAGYTMGLAAGYIIYHCQKKGFDGKRFRKYRYFVPLIVPLAICLIYACSWFYGDRPRASIWVRSASAVVLKPTFTLLVALIIFTFVFKIDDLCRRIVEWRGWTVPSRLSYCGYLLHVAFVRNYIAWKTTTFQTSLEWMMVVFTGIFVLSFITAVPLWLMVEAPVGNLIREYIMKSKTDKEKSDDDKQNEPIEQINGSSPRAVTGQSSSQTSRRRLTGR